MTEEQSAKYLLSKKETRITLCEKSFFYFLTHYFKFPLSTFQAEWVNALETNLDLLIVAFRASRKTTLIRIFAIWCIVFKKEPSIIVQSYEDSLSWEWVREIAKMLFNKKIVQDYWVLFPLETKKEELTKKSITNFETKNKVRIRAKSLWGTIRWANSFDIEEEKSSRPTLLILDDIDVDDSVNNINTIDKNERKVFWETVNALDPTRRRIIFLWNVIKKDWLVPRAFEKYKNNPMWRCFWQALFDEDWNNVYPEVFTDEVIEKLKSDWTTSFNQNYLLKPYIWGESIIKRHYIKYWVSETYEKVVIWIDPSISEKKLSDNFGVTITWFSKGKKYILACYALTWAEKDVANATKIIKWFYNRYKANIVNVETVAFQVIYAKAFKEAWMATREINPHKDKVTRLMEFEHDFEKGNIYFNPDWEWIQDLINEVIEFPNVLHDDRVDSMVYSFYAPKLTAV